MQPSMVPSVKEVYEDELREEKESTDGEPHALLEVRLEIACEFGDNRAQQWRPL